MKSFWKFGFRQLSDGTFFCPWPKSLEKRFLADKTFFFLLIRRERSNSDSMLKSWFRRRIASAGFDASELWIVFGSASTKPGADAYSKDIFLLLKLHCIRSKRLYGYNLHIPSETLPDISRFVPAGTRSSGWDLQHLWCCSKPTYRNRTYFSVPVLSAPVHVFHRYEGISVSEVPASDGGRCVQASPDRQPEASLT